MKIPDTGSDEGTNSGSQTEAKPSRRDAPFHHVLMTRFNLATPGREFSIRTQPGWLEGRFDLFEQYCLPSVAAQTSHDFDWVIYFDIDTPQEFKDRIATLQKVFAFRAFYTPMFGRTGWQDSIRSEIAPRTPFLLTTRLDSDDALATTFFERLHTEIAVQGHAPGAYNFRNGLIRRGEAVYKMAHDSNPFFSFLEINDAAIRTAPGIHHMAIDETGPVVQIDGPPAWMQVVHDTNVSNRVRGARIVPDAAVTSHFPAAAVAGLQPPTFVERLHEAVMGPLRRLRDRLVALIPRKKGAM